MTPIAMCFNIHIFKIIDMEKFPYLRNNKIKDGIFFFLHNESRLILEYTAQLTTERFNYELCDH